MRMLGESERPGLESRFFSTLLCGPRPVTSLPQAIVSLSIKKKNGNANFQLSCCGYQRLYCPDACPFLLSLHPTLHPLICPSLYLSLHQSTHLGTHHSFHPSIIHHLTISILCAPIPQPVRVSIHPPVHPSSFLYLQ